jgi:integrase
MAGRNSIPLYERDGVWYARVNGKRWSTETSDEQEARRRRDFMVVKNKPWSELKWNIGDKVVIRIDPTGNTYSELIQHFSEPTEAIHKLKTLTQKNRPQTTMAGPEPSKDCKDISQLLDYEYGLKAASDTPKNTLLYYRQRYDCLKRYIHEQKVDLDTFTKKPAFGYANFRLVETVRHEGDLGFNNRKASAVTINKEIKHFRNLWRTWKEEGRITENPWARVPFVRPSGLEEEIEPEPYTFDEVTAIIENIEELPIRAVCIFQCVLGTRPGDEVLKITKKAILAGKIWNAKKRRWDTFHYSEEAINFFDEYIEGKTEGLTSEIIRKAFKKACERAGVREGTPYDLRHWFGTESLLDNKLEVVQLMLRHKNIKTTQVYAKVRNSAMAQAQTKMQQKVLQKMGGSAEPSNIDTKD